MEVIEVIASLLVLGSILRSVHIAKSHTGNRLQVFLDTIFPNLDIIKTEK